LKKVIENHPYTLKNSEEFVDSIKQIELRRGYIKVSVDVKSLFTNVPIKDGLLFVKKRLETDLIWKN